MTLDVLAIAAHPDDAELGVGGTLMALSAAGCAVGVLDLTDGEPTPRGDPATRAREAEAATRVLGLDFRRRLDLPNRTLADTPEARVAVAEVLRETQPQVVLAHHPDDAHPDHVAAAAICDAARFSAKMSRTGWRGERWYPPRLYAFHVNHARVQAPVTFVVDITAVYDRKLAAIACYASQGTQDGSIDAAREWMHVEARARHFGTLADVRYGEAFHSPEPLVVDRLPGSLLPARRPAVLPEPAPRER